MVDPHILGVLYRSTADPRLGVSSKSMIEVVAYVAVDGTERTEATEGTTGRAW